MKKLFCLAFVHVVNSSCVFPQFFAPPNWTEGMDQEQIRNIISIFHPDVRQTLPDITVSLCSIMLKLL